MLILKGYPQMTRVGPCPKKREIPSQTENKRGEIRENQVAGERFRKMAKQPKPFE